MGARKAAISSAAKNSARQPTAVRQSGTTQNIGASRMLPPSPFSSSATAAPTGCGTGSPSRFSEMKARAATGIR